MTKEEYDYVRNIAQESITQEEAVEFLVGLEQHNKPSSLTYVKYDIISNSFLTTKIAEFPSFEEAWVFARGLRIRNVSITRPTIYSRYTPE